MPWCASACASLKRSVTVMPTMRPPRSAGGSGARSVVVPRLVSPSVTWSKSPLRVSIASTRLTGRPAVVTRSETPAAAGGSRAPFSAGGAAGRSRRTSSACETEAKSLRQLRIDEMAPAGTPRTVASAASPGAGAVAAERTTGAASVPGASRRYADNGAAWSGSRRAAPSESV
jgi:hypothetical protein